jgi:dienelactone hydrolase
MKKPSALFAYASLCVVAITAAMGARAELITIAAPHIGNDKTLRLQVFAPKPDADTLTVKRPAAVLMHGCGGIGAKGELNERHAMWKDWLVARGFVVVFPESFTSRGVEQICTQKFSDRDIKQRDRVADVMAARKWLLERNDVDASKLVLWGWSHGGGTVLSAITIFDRPTSAVYDKNPPDRAFAQSISFYPGCTNFAASARSQTLAAPLLLLIGEADDWTPAAPCQAWIKQMQAAKQLANIALYPGAFHDFDSPGAKLRVRKDVPNGTSPGKGVTVGPDPVAREDAKRRIDALLRERGIVAESKTKASPKDVTLN